MDAKNPTYKWVRVHDLPNFEKLPLSRVCLCRWHKDIWYNNLAGIGKRNKLAGRNECCICSLMHVETRTESSASVSFTIVSGVFSEMIELIETMCVSLQTEELIIYTSEVNNSFHKKCINILIYSRYSFFVWNWPLLSFFRLNYNYQTCIKHQV